ncbi:ATP-binding protein [Nesterenkonia sp. LB17]|uniref:ATP-binding protein n=1 Tax=unclassified Nesterenkonia TaxID=2629769 RepID=UPI001F4CB78E|nr:MULTISPECIES: ATP-binding protein [unclassified Nesterenkonia]MCH8559153.1 ATP-binding protein [Nesterenkonia sp. DZ6]MCH8563066.1 ATP-binding protein [Nesterenkonia sp. YGD6]MCH8565118.1 ATP-binding protein [Nesterenkonia sp. LB17]
MGDGISRVSLTGTAELTFVDQVLDALERLCRAADGISEEDRTFFSLAVSEIATNIVTHSGCEGDAEVTVIADLTVDDAALSARFQDDAAPVAVALEEAELPDELAESGRGLAIAKMALDQLSHEVNNGHIWTLVRKRR